MLIIIYSLFDKIKVQEFTGKQDYIYFLQCTIIGFITEI